MRRLAARLVRLPGGDFANGAVMAAAQYAFNALARSVGTRNNGAGEVDEGPSDFPSPLVIAKANEAAEFVWFNPNLNP